MSEFKSWMSFWNYESEIKSKNRYIHSKCSTSFLKTVLKTSKKRIIPIKKGRHYWRAQLGNDVRQIKQDGFE